MNMKKGVLLLGIVGLSGLGWIINQKSKSPRQYSYEWISKLSDEEWKSEREHIRKNVFCNPDLSTTIRLEAQRLLDLFDKVWREKHYTGEIGFPAYREHGWYINKE